MGNAKKHGAKYGLNKSFLRSLKPFMLAAVCDQNRKNFPKSIVYWEVRKLPESEVKEALLEKYCCLESLNSENTAFFGFQNSCNIQ